MAEKNTGKSYELLTMRIFDDLLKQDQVETIRLEHDVTLEGKTTGHQIDVYWEFRAGGVIYRTCVQAKDWAQTVSQGSVMTFNSALNDLNIRATGIMVCKSGYQQGAKNFANGNGILLYELREVREEDWSGRVRNISVKLHILRSHFSEFKPEIDRDWLQEQVQLHNIPTDEAMLIQFADARKVNIQTEDGIVIETVSDALNRNLPKPLVLLPKTTIDHKFEVPVFIPIPHSQLTHLKITGYKAAMWVEAELIEDIEFSGDDLVRFILENVLDGTARFFPKGSL